MGSTEYFLMWLNSIRKTFIPFKPMPVKIVF